MKNIDSVIFRTRKSRKEKPKPRLVEVTINPELNDAVANYVGLKGNLREYMRLSEEIRELEGRKKELRVGLDQAIAGNGDKLTIGDYDCSFTRYTSRSFDFDSAFKALGESALSPFIDSSPRVRLNIKPAIREE